MKLKMYPPTLLCLQRSEIRNKDAFISRQFFFYFLVNYSALLRSLQLSCSIEYDKEKLLVRFNSFTYRILFAGNSYVTKIDNFMSICPLFLFVVGNLAMLKTDIENWKNVHRNAEIDLKSAS